MSKAIYFMVVAGVFILASTYLVSAGLGEWWAGITGRATSGNANASVTLSGDDPVVIYIYNDSTIGEVSPTEASFNRVTFTLDVHDSNGRADINYSSVSINVSRGSELVKVNSSCVNITDEFGDYNQNFSCTFDMWYFEEAGVWTVTAEANDKGTKTYVNNQSTFKYNSLNAIQISPNDLTWPGLSPGATDAQSDNDPMYINNTGNYNIDNLTIKGQDLIGETNPSNIIYAENFTVDIDSGGAECTVGATGAQFVNDTAVEIIDAVANRGNLSIGGGSGQEELNFCIPLVPLVESQAYSTTASDEWVIESVELPE